MRVVILDTYYPRFLTSIYDATPGLADCGYSEQKTHLLAQAFGTADFYSQHLNGLGCETHDLIANCRPLQEAWARENGIVVAPPAGLVARAFQRLRGGPRRIEGSYAASLEAVALAQVRQLAPDVLYCQDLSFLSPSAMAEARRYARLVVGQIASPLPAMEFLRGFDLILTSFPHFVPRFRAMGIASEYFRIGFEPSVLERIGAPARTRDVTFVGGISPAHAHGNALLEALARHVPLEVFGYGADALPRNSALRACHRGEVWGLAMYRTLAESKITINRHIDVAEDYANNMRLYETTGCGALLLTDAKRNLGEFFRVGEEILTYRNADEAITLVQQYIADEGARERIARAGGARTLAEHTYEARMQELVPILEQILATQRGRTRIAAPTR